VNKSLLLLASTLLVLLGCQSDGDNHQGKTVFRYNEASGISSLDPAFARGQADVWACNQIYNGLLQLDDSLKVRPCIAKGFTVSGDGLEYRFTLRNDVFFQHDESFIGGKGRAVTAHDFVYSFNRILDPKTLSPGTWVFNQVLRDLDGKAHFIAINDTILSIRLAQPFPPFPGLLTMQYCSVVPKEAVERYGKEFRKNPVGTGPFKLFYWEERVGLVLHRNSDYFERENGVQLPLVDAVSVSFLSDKQAAFMEFVKGKLDFISGIDASYKDELLDRDGNLKGKYRAAFQMQKAPYLNTEYLGILMDSKSETNPLKNLLIRKAINHGFDRERMIRFLRNGIGTPGIYGMVPPGMPGFDHSKVKGYQYDPTLSAKLLSEAGYPGGKGLPEITLSTTKEYQDLCEYIQGQLGELGIRIKIDVNQGATHREMVAKQKLDFFRGSWIADYPDAENYLSLFYKPNQAPAGPNYTHYGSQAFDSLFRYVIMNTNEAERNEKYVAMDQMAMNDAPVVVLYYDQVIRLQGNHISGLGMNAMNLLSLKRVRIKSGD
jgi:peptide/nickel transport system substrate-binding protein